VRETRLALCVAQLRGIGQTVQLSFPASSPEQYVQPCRPRSGTRWRLLGLKSGRSPTRIHLPSHHTAPFVLATPHPRRMSGSLKTPGNGKRTLARTWPPRACVPFLCLRFPSTRARCLWMQTCEGGMDHASYADKSWLGLQGAYVVLFGISLGCESPVERCEGGC